MNKSPDGSFVTFNRHERHALCLPEQIKKWPVADLQKLAGHAAMMSQNWHTVGSDVVQQPPAVYAERAGWANLVARTSEELMSKVGIDERGIVIEDNVAFDCKPLDITLTETR